jgi:hypothetical protein
MEEREIQPKARRRKKIKIERELRLQHCTQ